MTASEIRALIDIETTGTPSLEGKKMVASLEIAAQLADLNEQLVDVRRAWAQILPDVQKAFAKLGKGFLGL